MWGVILLADAKPAEDPIEDILGIDHSGYLTQVIEGFADFGGNKFFAAAIGMHITMYIERSSQRCGRRTEAGRGTLCRGQDYAAVVAVSCLD